MSVAVRTVAILPVKQLRARQAAPRATTVSPIRAGRWPRRWWPTCSTRCAAAATIDAVIVVDRRPRRRSGWQRRRRRGRGRRRRRGRPQRGRADRRSPTRARAWAPSACCSSPATARCSTRPSSTAARAPRGPTWSIVPDRHGTGTNALLLTPPDAIAPAFGPGSSPAPRRAGRRGRRRRSRSSRCASLALDVDTPDDLDSAARRAGRRAPAAPRTRAACSTLARACVTAQRAVALGLPGDRAGRRPRGAARGGARRAGGRRRRARGRAQGRLQGRGARSRALADVEPSPRALALAAELGKDPRHVQVGARRVSRDRARADAAC